MNEYEDCKEFGALGGGKGGGRGKRNPRKGSLSDPRRNNFRTRDVYPRL